jgi:hypothetical protein
MGIFSKIFGNDDSSKQMPDGQWLKGERNGDWEEVGNLNSSQSIELNESSCFIHKVGTVFILRSYRPDTKGMIYMGCIAFGDDADFINILVDRVERSDGSASQRDNWSLENAIVQSKVSNVQEIINIATNLANFNDYTSIPPYGMILIHKFIELNQFRQKRR